MDSVWRCNSNLHWPYEHLRENASHLGHAADLGPVSRVVVVVDTLHGPLADGSRCVHGHHKVFVGEKIVACRQKNVASQRATNCVLLVIVCE